MLPSPGRGTPPPTPPAPVELDVVERLLLVLSPLPALPPVPGSPRRTPGAPRITMLTVRRALAAVVETTRARARGA
jgi:hypothetical protein